MERKDFSYIKCTNCGNVNIVPISYKNEYSALCAANKGYDLIAPCCTKPLHNYASVEYGLEHNHIKESDLPEALRKEIRSEYRTECGMKKIIVLKGDKRTEIMVDGDRIKINYANGTQDIRYIFP